MIPRDDLLSLSSGFGQNCKFIFFVIFFNCAFHLVFVVATTNLSCYCWCILTTSELIRFWLSSFDFHHFSFILTLWNRPNLHLPDIFWRTPGRNGLNFGLLMYPDHLQNLLNFVHGLSICLILASFRLSETGQIWGVWRFSAECMGGMA